MTSEEVAVTGLIALAICLLLLPSMGATFAPPSWCYGLAILTSVVIVAFGTASALVRRSRVRKAKTGEILMATTEFENSVSVSRKKRWRLATPLLIAIGVIVVVMLSAWQFWVRPYREHGRLVARLENCIIQLAQKRPPDTSRDEWSFMLAWTWNAKCNCVSLPEYIRDYPRFRQMVDECEQRADGPVGIETIDWFWNEIEATSRNGAKYSDRYRPTRLDNPLREQIGEFAFFEPVE